MHTPTTRSEPSAWSSWLFVVAMVVVGVLIEGRIRFDPERDDIKRVEVVENGEVIQTFERQRDTAEVAFQFKHSVTEAGWRMGLEART